MFLILPKALSKFFSWPKLDEGCWNYHMIPVHSRAVFILPSGAKIITILPFWPLFCHWFGYYFASVWKIDTTSLICEGSCILCPNFENFCPNNCEFFSVGYATASPCRTLIACSMRLRWPRDTILLFLTNQSSNQQNHLFKKPFDFVFCDGCQH